MWQSTSSWLKRDQQSCSEHVHVPTRCNLPYSHIVQLPVTADQLSLDVCVQLEKKKKNGSAIKRWCKLDDSRLYFFIFKSAQKASHSDVFRGWTVRFRRIFYNCEQINSYIKLIENDEKCVLEMQLEGLKFQSPWEILAMVLSLKLFSQFFLFSQFTTNKDLFVFSIKLVYL